MKIWGKVQNKKIILAKHPKISATCIRVPVSDGHMAHVSITFAKKPTQEQILNAIKEFNQNNQIAKLNLPSAPKEFIHYFSEENRPQTKLDRNREHGMGISMGKLKEEKHFDYSCITLSHNTIREAAGGAIPTAELLVKKGFIR